MKICRQGMKVTLPIHGRERTFSEQELIAILEKHFSNEFTEQVTTAELALETTEDKCFEVNPQAIDQSLFQKKREDESQEKTRKLIVEAFAEVKSSPEKYDKKFKTVMPKKTWTSETVEDLKQVACKLGDHNADWVEQALEWAQRIFNGESWEVVCNNDDTANWYRLVVWKNGYARLVGGSLYGDCSSPASYVSSTDYDSDFSIELTVPLVVLYEEKYCPRPLTNF